MVVLTQVQRREMAERLHIAEADKFAVIPLGLDLARFRQVDARGARGITGSDSRSEWWGS